MKRKSNHYSDPLRAYKELRSLREGLRNSMNTRSTMARITYHHDLARHRMDSEEEKAKEDKEGEDWKRRKLSKEKENLPAGRLLRMEKEDAQNGIRSTEWKGNKNVQLKLSMEEEEEYLPAGRLLRMEKEDAQNGIRRGDTEWKTRKLSIEEEVPAHWLGTQDKRRWRRERTALKICLG